MGELTSLLKQGMPSDDPKLVGGGSDIVNGQVGEVGSSTNTIPEEAKGDVSLRLPHKDGDVVSYDKENRYPSRIRNPDSSSQKIEKSKLGDDNMGLEDKPEKRAAIVAQRLMNDVDDYVNNYLKKQSSVPEMNLQESMDQIALQKAAAFESGREFIRAILKKAEEAEGGDGPLENSKEHRGDLADTAVGRLVPRSDPHKVSDNKSAETDPSSSGDKKAPKHMQGNAQVDSTLMSKAELELAQLKSDLFEDFQKAAQADDAAALAIAKANIYDFLTETGAI